MDAARRPDVGQARRGSRRRCGRGRRQRRQLWYGRSSRAERRRYRRHRLGCGGRCGHRRWGRTSWCGQRTGECCGKRASGSYSGRSRHNCRGEWLAKLLWGDMRRRRKRRWCVSRFFSCRRRTSRLGGRKRHRYEDIADTGLRDGLYGPDVFNENNHRRQQ